MNTPAYGTRIARCTYEPCSVCGSFVTLTEGTRVGMSEGGEDEIHVTEECEHRVSRPVLVWCRPSEAEEWFPA